jgi:low temperature requirement protein LtrA
MGGAGTMAVNIAGAFNNTFSGFALSYAFMGLILVIEYVNVFRATTIIQITPRVGRREWDSNIEAVIRGLYY